MVITETKAPEEIQPIELVDSSPTDEAEKVEEKIIGKMTKCGILPSYSTRKDGTCVRYHICRMQGRTKNPKCPARGGVLR